VKSLGYKIKRLRLFNIKSHANTTVEFSSGVNLIEGDVGSGKSTILQSIEAALFGYKAKDLIRVGEDEARLDLTLDPDLEVEWKIGLRGLKGGAVLTNGKKTELASGQIREFMVKRLRLGENYNTNSEPKVFRTAVYIRQEELKSILDGGDEVEDLVRKVTGIKRYSVARENSSVLVEWISSEIRKYEDRIMLLEPRVKENEDVKVKLSQATSKFEAVSLEREETENRHAVLDQEVKDAQARIFKMEADIQALKSFLREKEEEVRKLEGELAGLNSSILELEERRLGYPSVPEQAINFDEICRREALLRQRVAELNRAKGERDATFRALRELHDEKQRLSSAIRADLDYASLREMLTSIQIELNGALELKGQLEKTIRDYRSLISSGNCPVCHRPINPQEYTRHLQEEMAARDKVEAELAEYRKRQTDLQFLLEEAKKQENLVERLAEVDKQIAEKTEYLARVDSESQLTDASVELEEVTKIKEAYSINRELEDKRKQWDEVQRKIEELRAHSVQLKAKLQETQGLFSKEKPKLDSKIKEYEQLSERLRKLVSEEASVKQQLEHLGQLAKLYESDLSQLNSSKRTHEFLVRLRDFFEKVFEPGLEKIELEKLRLIKKEVSQRMREYFAVLMQDEDRSVELKENLQPCLQRRVDGKWVTIQFPSGGERSTMALAYRLALSSVARSRQGIQMDFLLLDEPTDGFSDEQLTKFQAVLERMDVPQIVLVTHHKALESMGGTIIQVDYGSNGSVVKRVE
jgi:exonuclease SbcC